MDADDKITPTTIPQFARPAGRGRPPAKVFVTKTFSARLPVASKTVSLQERLQGRGPVVKWPQAKRQRPLVASAFRALHPNASGAAGPVLGTPNPAASTNTSTRTAATPTASTPTASTGETMSERFIAERLLSDRGTSSFNPQVPRRVPDIPSPASVKANEADAEGKRLFIGRQVQLAGEISGCERLVVEGKVDATLKDVKTIEVGAQGAFKGTAAVESAIIAGSFEGTLRVSGHLDIGPGAVVKGTVSYGSIAVANGGKLMGTVESTDAASET